MKLIQTRHVTRFAQKFTLVLTESVVNDVAAYECKGHVSGDQAARAGVKMTERDARRSGFTIPAGKHYRK